jgi:DNA topoisomerase VI subunit A
MAQAKPKKPGALEVTRICVADAVITAAELGRDPTLSIPVRSLANIHFNEGMAKTFMQTVLAADALSELQRADLTTSLREIDYRTKHTVTSSHENTLDGQDESDPLIEDLEVSLAAMREESKIPVYVLVDNDPWGHYIIYSVVKQGSINLAFESERMAISKARFIGPSTADPDAYGLPRNVGIKLNDKDIGRAKELLKYRWRMLASDLEYELDALANKDFRYLTRTYLPGKLEEEDWLD